MKKKAIESPTLHSSGKLVHSCIRIKTTVRRVCSSARGMHVETTVRIIARQLTLSVAPAL